MHEVSVALGTLLMTVVALPRMWRACDRRCTLLRLSYGAQAADLPARGHSGGPGESHSSPTPLRRRRGAPSGARKRRTEHGPDAVAFLTAVARAVRSGMPAADAILCAPAVSPAVTEVQHRLRTGMGISDALLVDDRLVTGLSACVHHGVISVDSLDLLVSAERSAAETAHEVMVAMSHARHSARMLTVAPFAFLAVVALVSGSVRGAVLSPSLAVPVSIGIALNRAGSAWMTRSAAAALREDPATLLSLTVASTVAVHVRAGGDIPSAFALLAPRSTECADVTARLRRGDAIADALAPIEKVCPQLVRVITTAHADGLPVSTVLETFAADETERRAAQLRSRIRQLPARSTSPLVLCVLPSFLLIAVAPPALAALGGLTGPTIQETR